MIRRVKVRDTELAVRDTGPAGAPVILFSHGLLMDNSMFEEQVAVLSSKFRCIAHDHRGQGASAHDGSSRISIDTVTADASALIDELDLGPVHFVGHSMGASSACISQRSARP